MTSIDRKLEDWKRKLLDLTRRNPALFFKLQKPFNLRVQSPGAQQLLSRLLIEEKKRYIFIPPPLPESDPEALELGDEDLGNYEPTRFASPGPEDVVFAGRDGKVLRRRIKSLHRSAREDFEERALETLHIALGLLNWSEGRSEICTSPLLLVPVTLERDAEEDRYTLGPADEDPVLNPSLVAKLSESFGLNLPDIPDDFEQHDYASWLQSVEETVRPYKWAVEDSCWLARFSFHKLSLYQDLNANAEKFKESALIRALTGEPSNAGAISGDLPQEERLDQDVRPHDSYTVLDADSSQLVCIEAVDRGHNLVVQGPPGTGKSQTIVNLIAQLLAKGKTVLFVSEKIAALEVVFNRLKAVNLGDLCLELHSHKANKREVVSELYRTLRTRPALNGQPTEPDLDRLEKRRFQLNDYAGAIFERYGSMRRNMFSVLGEIAKLDDVPYVSCSYDFASINDASIELAVDLARELSRVWDVAVQGFSHPWYGCTTAGSLLAQKSALVGDITRLAAASQGIDEELRRVTALLGIRYTDLIDEATTIHDVACVVDQSPGIKSRWLTYDGEALRAEIASWKTAYDERDQLQAWLRRENVERTVDVAPFNTDSWMLQEKQLSGIATGKGTQDRVLRSTPEILTWLRAMRVSITELRRTITDVQSALDVSSESSIHAAVTLLRAADAADSADCPEPAWFDRRTYTTLRDELPRLQHDVQVAEDAKRTILERYDEELLNLDLDTLIHKFSNEYRSILRFFNRDYRDTIASLRACRRDGVLPRDIIGDLREARECVRVANDANSNNARAIGILGARYRGPTTDFPGIARALDTVRDVNAIMASPSERMLRIACGLESPVSLRAMRASLKASVSTFRGLREQTNALNDGAHLIGVEQELEHADFTMLDAHLTKLADVVAELHEYLGAAFNGYPASVSIEWVSDVARKVDGYRLAQSSCSHIREGVQSRFGPEYVIEGVPNWAKLHDIALWLRNREKIGTYSNPKLLERLRQPDSKIGSRIDACIQDVQSAVGVFRVSFMEPQSESKKDMESGNIARISAICTRLTDAIDRIQEWRDFVALRSRFAEQQLGDLFGKMEATASLSGCDLPNVVKKSLLQGYVDHQFSLNAILADFRGSTHDELIRDFAHADKRIIRGNYTRVLHNALEARPDQFVAYQGSESRVLLTEANKKRRHLPIRKLFAAMPRLLQQLKPCLLMSPLSVSQFLVPEAISFDCVIFDEASQICSEDAVSAIYRAKQLVVCGDKQQLPPTNFFKEASGDDPDLQNEEEEVAAFESILAEADTAGFPSKQLKWHYRSAHESLIAFSNERFYNYSLVTFPSATLDADATMVNLCYVADGVYDRGGRRDNPREADRVVQLVLDHIAQHPEQSLGVVAFSKQQADAIQNRLDLLRKQRRDLESLFSDDRVNGFFVKNLERVQGDERDRIIFSIGYGRDKNGRLTMNFGPLNVDGGEKRLNVAVTRARLGVTVVSSIRASDMDLTQADKAGVLALHRYLDFAERGYAALDLNLINADYDSPFEEDVAGEIRAMGYPVRLQVGVSGFRIDLGVIDPAQPGRFILGVECDGATYHSAYTARDRDRLRQEILESKMGWRLHRIWSPDWAQQRSVEIERLRNAMEAARSYVPPSASTMAAQTLSAPSETVAESATPVEQFAMAQLAQIEESPERYWIRPYKISTISARKLPCDFHDPTAIGRLSEMALEVINCEAPVHKNIVASRVAGRWGLSRVGSRMVEAMERAYGVLLRCGEIQLLDDTFLAPNHNFQCEYVRCPVPGQPETLRPIEHVSSDELAVAINALLLEAVSFEREQLIIQVARALGYDRTGNAIEKRVALVIGSLLHQGVLAEQAGRIVLV